MNIQKRHYDILVTRLEETLLQGISRITYDELIYWFDRHKIGKPVWAYINNEWNDLPNMKGRDVDKPREKGELMIKIIHNSDAYYLLSGQGLKNISEYTAVPED